MHYVLVTDLIEYSCEPAHSLLACLLYTASHKIWNSADRFTITYITDTLLLPSIFAEMLCTTKTYPSSLLLKVFCSSYYWCHCFQPFLLPLLATFQLEMDPGFQHLLYLKQIKILYTCNTK
jgi:hypothetical protein